MLAQVPNNPRPAAEGFCGLSVGLLSSDGSPARLTPVRLVDPSGKTVYDEQVEGPTFQICDFGFGPHTLIIGYGFCYPVTISGLPEWSKYSNSLKIRKLR